MTTKEELLGLRRRRFAITGPRGCGKTTACVAVARDYAAAGNKVLYLDLWEEVGAVEELLQLEDKIVANINYKTPKKYQDVMMLLTPGMYQFVVVDALQNIRVLSNDQAVDALINAQADNEGDKEDGKGILRKLRQQGGVVSASALAWGKGTGTQKEFERFFISRLWSMNCDILCSMNTKSLSASENFIEALGGFFDVIVEMDRVATSNRTWDFRFSIDKYRGAEVPTTVPMTLKRGENVMQKVDDLLKPKPRLEVKPFHCAQHEREVTLSESRDCMLQNHELKSLS